MDVAALLLEAFDRISPLAHDAVEGVPLERLAEPPAPGANTIAWLVWHIARVQDSHIAELVGSEQLWVTGDWADGFGLPPDPSNSGYGHTEADVLAVRPRSAEALLAYFDAATAQARALLADVTPDGLDRIVDRRWDPPVTLGVRLVSVIDDSTQHVGQAGFVKGLLGC